MPHSVSANNNFGLEVYGWMGLTFELVCGRMLVGYVNCSASLAEQFLGGVWYNL